MTSHETTTPSPKRWNAFVCPDCRSIFRVSKDHDGQGIVCPTCSRLQRIPREGDETLPLVAPSRPKEFKSTEQIMSTGETRSRKKRRRTPADETTPSWEANRGQWRESNKKKDTFTFRILAVWSFSIISIFVLNYFYLNWKYPKKVVTNNLDYKQAESTLVPLLVPDEQLEAAIQLPRAMKRSESELLATMEPMVKTFFEASHVDQILPLIRDPERVRPRLLTQYPDGKLKPVGIAKFNESKHISYKDAFLSVNVLTNDYETKSIAFIDGKEGLKIDWESFIGWSEIPWEKISTIKSQKPFLIRARLKWTEYYNFNFTDELLWRSYQLTSPDGEIQLYGYAGRNSLLDQKLRPHEQKTETTVTLKIRFPENPSSDNQVIIEELIADGWLLPE